MQLTRTSSATTSLTNDFSSAISDNLKKIKAEPRQNNNNNNSNSNGIHASGLSNNHNNNNSCIFSSSSSNSITHPSAPAR